MSRGRWFKLLVVLIPAGCVASPRPLPQSPPTTSIAENSSAMPGKSVVLNKQVFQAAFEKQKTQDGAPLSLEDLIVQSAKNRPEMAIARARVDAARGKLVQAGLYPNPLVGWEADHLGNSVAGAGQQGLDLAQEIVTAGKLQLAQQAAAHGVTALEWQAITRWNEQITRIRLAYFDWLTAQKEVATNEAIRGFTKTSLEITKRLVEGGSATQPDLLRAQVEFDQARAKLAFARQRSDAAFRSLKIATGVSDLSAKKLERLESIAAREYSWNSLVAEVVKRSSEIQEAQANIMQAEQQVRQALAERVPNLRTTVKPYYSIPDRDMQVLVAIGANLPIWNRNQGNIQAAQADLTRLTQEAKLVEFRLLERLTTAYQRYQTALQQMKRYKEIVPNAQKSLALVRRGYDKGDTKFNYTVVLQAQQTLAAAELAYVQAQGEFWRALAELAGLLQSDKFPW